MKEVWFSETGADARLRLANATRQHQGKRSAMPGGLPGEAFGPPILLGCAWGLAVRPRGLSVRPRSRAESRRFKARPLAAYISPGMLLSDDERKVINAFRQALMELKVYDPAAVRNFQILLKSNRQQALRELEGSRDLVSRLKPRTTRFLNMRWPNPCIRIKLLHKPKTIATPSKALAILGGARVNRQNLMIRAYANFALESRTALIEPQGVFTFDGTWPCDHVDWAKRCMESGQALRFEVWLFDGKSVSRIPAVLDKGRTTVLAYPNDEASKDSDEREHIPQPSLYDEKGGGQYVATYASQRFHGPNSWLTVKRWASEVPFDRDKAYAPTGLTADDIAELARGLLEWSATGKLKHPPSKTELEKALREAEATPPKCKHCGDPIPLKQVGASISRWGQPPRFCKKTDCLRSFNALRQREHRQSAAVRQAKGEHDQRFTELGGYALYGGLATTKYLDVAYCLRSDQTRNRRKSPGFAEEDEREAFAIQTTPSQPKE